MPRIAKAIRHSLSLAGVNPFQTFRTLRRLPRYFLQLRILRKQASAAGEHFPIGPLCPCIGDDAVESGAARGHYFHQDLLVARRIFKHSPPNHTDVGSRIDGFVAHVASFRHIRVLDIRPLRNTIPNIEFIRADLMRALCDNLVESAFSLSCLHTLEHFGLGRYGDSIDYNGYRLGFENLTRILKPGGRMYFSVPIGPQRIEFNAHRVFSISTLLDLFSKRFEVAYFSFVDDAGDLHEDVRLSNDLAESNCGCVYGCGIFELVKR